MAAPGLSSVTSALRIFTHLAEFGEMGVTELARESGLPKSVVHRLLTTMKPGRFVAQIQSSRRYRIGPAVRAVGQSFINHDNIFSVAVAVAVRAPDPAPGSTPPSAKCSWPRCRTKRYTASTPTGNSPA